MILGSSKVLVVVAHPDDEALGTGGTIRRLVNEGAEVDLLVATDGSSAQFGNDMTARARRSDHLGQACEILGIGTLEVLDFPDMRLDTVPHIELNKAVSRVVQNGSYDTILTHHPGDINNDHRHVFETVMVVARPQPNVRLKTVATFFVNSSSEWGAFYPHRVFTPNVFVDISATIDDKLAALDVYKDEVRQFPHPRSLQAVNARAQTTGSEVGVTYAEAFQLIRTVAPAGDDHT